MKAVIQRVTSASVAVDGSVCGKIGNGFLVVSQFTLCADTRRGNRPDFFGVAKPALAEPLYEYFSKYLRETFSLPVENGIFGADMKVSLLNDGPVTILMDTDEWK